MPNPVDQTSSKASSSSRKPVGKAWVFVLKNLFIWVLGRLWIPKLWHPGVLVGLYKHWLDNSFGIDLNFEYDFLLFIYHRVSCHVLISRRHRALKVCFLGYDRYENYNRNAPRMIPLHQSCSLLTSMFPVLQKIHLNKAMIQKPLNPLVTTYPIGSMYDIYYIYHPKSTLHVGESTRSHDDIPTNIYLTRFWRAFLVGIVGKVDFFAGLLDLSEFSQRHQSLSSSRQSGFCWQAGFMTRSSISAMK